MWESGVAYHDINPILVCYSALSSESLYVFELSLPVAEASKAPAASGAGASGSAKQAKAAKASSQIKDNASVVASEKKGGDRQSEKDRKKDVPHPRMQFDDKTRVEKAKKRAVVKQTEARNRVELFRHLPQYEHGTQLPDLESKFFQLEPMHPDVYKVSCKLFISCSGNALSGVRDLVDSI